MEITIRRATLDDLESLMQWRMDVLREVFSMPVETDIKALTQANKAYYQVALQDESHIACFALCRGEVVGCGGICFHLEMPSPDNLSGRCGYLMNIYVQPAFRQHGVGRRIVQWLVRQAVQRNTTKVYLEASETGRTLYQDLGFVAMSGQMLLPLGKAQDIAAEVDRSDLGSCR